MSAIACVWCGAATAGLFGLCANAACEGSKTAVTARPICATCGRAHVEGVWWPRHRFVARKPTTADLVQALPPLKESQASISEWADATFGPAGSNARVAARANEEMAELLRALTADDWSKKAGEEVADVLIVLYRLATRLGIHLHTEVDRKMAINRAREWKLDATGHGYHVRDK